MIDGDTLIQLLEAGERRRIERRRFLQVAGGATLAAGLGACSGGSDGGPTPTSTPTPSSTLALDAEYLNFALNLEYLNFALNLEYLEAQYFSWATTGAGISPALLTGIGTQGAVTGGAQVTFSNALNAEYAREIAADEIAHVGFLRSMTGSAAVAQPAIDLSGAAAGGFATLARAGGFVAAGASFDPYANDEAFLLGAFLLEDVVVSAYIGLIPLFSTALYRNAVAGILATESHHAALIRSQLSMSANLVRTDANGIVRARTPGQMLDIVSANHAASAGGFFPAGINGTLLARNDAH